MTAPHTLRELGVQPATVTYTNWRGETGVRRIVPLRVWFGSTAWHPEPQWLLTVLDVDKGLERDFALAGFDQPITVPDALATLRQATLKALGDAEEGYCLSLDGLSSRTGLPRETLRGIIADLRAEGLVSHHRGLQDDSGICCGAGYAITDAGAAALRAIAEGKA